MEKTNFLTTLEIFIEDDLTEFDLKDIFGFLEKNSEVFDKMFKGIYSYLLKERSAEKIRANLIDNIPKIMVIGRKALENLELKPGLNKEKITELKTILELMTTVDSYLKSNRFKFKPAS